ncbi:Bax inhibitor-1/YccA family protein [Desulfovibrio sp. OttesenSCG-928-G15]|nr:Bax inhibitor-1/YccA family protein [Desulfovibrio sp. OttesenSCG-928-G15]
MNNTATMPQQLSRAEVMNAFMRSIYNWMSLGLGLTAVIAFAFTYTGLSAFIYSPTGQTIGLACIVAELILVFTLSARVQKMKADTATGMFMLYSALNGFTLSFVLISYNVGSVVQAFIATAGMFGAMSLYGLYTKKDLTSWGSLLFMGLIGLIIAMVVNIFLESSMMNMLISLVGIVIFLGLTAYDTQLFREMGSNMPADEAVIRKGAVMGALSLYLNFINIFLMILRFMGASRD